MKLNSNEKLVNQPLPAMGQPADYRIEIMDQSALSGVLSTLCDLGYPLISVRHNPVNAHRENEIV